MIGFLRLLVLLLVVMTVFYILLRIYLRSLTRERLEKRFDATPHAGKKADFVAAGMRIYEKSARRRLLWGVYIVPFVVISVLIYVLNFT